MTIKERLTPKQAEHLKRWENHVDKTMSPEAASQVIGAAQAERMQRRALKARLRSMVLKRRAYHRETDRVETRAVQIAHGFLRGRPYAEMERICYTRPNWDRVSILVHQHPIGEFGSFLQGFEQWMQTAREVDNFRGSRKRGTWEKTREEILDQLIRKRDKLNSAIRAFGGAT